jgi:hypothetical protein
MIPTIQVLLERVELPGPYPVVLLDICDPRSTDRPVPGGAGFVLVGRMFSKRKETRAPSCGQQFKSVALTVLW